jgi:N-acetylmuramoyl-L-alanine amidase
LTNPEECDKLSTNDYQEKIALMIYMGILSFLEKYGEI